MRSDDPAWKRRQNKLERNLADMRRTQVDRTIGAHGAPQTYFAYSAGRIKIGTSFCPRARGANLNLQSPHPVTIILTVAGGCELEAQFHKLLRSERRHGEWFRLSKEMRWLLHQSLCRTGIKKFEKAEAEFRSWLREMDE